ncbi:hypothetical protein LCGC14_1897910, partial [marine sediment metagenome]
MSNSDSESHPVIRRLWTGDDEARDLLMGDEPKLEGVLLQQARVADSVTKPGKDDTRVRRFRISTETQDRQGDIIRSKGIVLKNFRKNPVVLFAHDSRMPPIGKSPKITLGDGVVDADVDFFDLETYEFADTIFRIVEAGGLKATSVGFMPLKYERMEEDADDNIAGTPYGIDFKKIDLLEFSIVPVPANPEAVRSIAKSGALMSPYKDWLDDMQDNWKHMGPVLLNLGIKEEDITAVRQAVNGDAASVRMPDDWGEEGEDTLLELEILDVDDKDEDDDPQPMMLHEDSYEDGVKIVQLEGEFPKHTSFSVELIEEADIKYFSREEETIVISLDNATAKYEIIGEDEDDGVIKCALIECDYKTPITWAQAHPDGTPAQPRDATWNAGREVREATVDSLGVMCTWRESKPKEDLVKGDFKFPHHKAGGQHAVNFRAIAAGVAVLNGARGGANIPDSDKRGVWNHLARHFRDNFDADPPDLKWIEFDVLKEFTDLFYFDYASAKLLVRYRSEADGTSDDGTSTFIDAREVEVTPDVSENAELVYPDSPKQEWVVHTLSSRQRKWTSLEQFKTWAEDEGYDTESLSETRHFWRLAQSDETVSDSIVISLYPNDVEPGSADCVVAATLVPKEAEVPSDDVSKTKLQSAPTTFALAADGLVEIGVPLEDLDQTDGEDKQGWALLMAGLDVAPQVLVLEAGSAQEADEIVRGMAKAFGSKSLYLGRLAGMKDGASVYTDYALYRFKNGTVRKIALDAEAIDELQDFLDGLERLKMIVQDLSDDERQQLMAAKEWLDEELVEERDDSEEDDDLETLLVQSLSED